MIVTVFRHRLSPDTRPEYDALPARIVGLATQAGQQGWRTHPEHVEAMKLGRQKLYTDFKAPVCDIRRTAKKVSRDL